MPSPGSRSEPPEVSARAAPTRLRRGRDLRSTDAQPDGRSAERRKTPSRSEPRRHAARAPGRLFRREVEAGEEGCVGQATGALFEVKGKIKKRKKEKM